MAIDYNQLLTNPELGAFASQRKLAEMLLKQGSQTPQGQMIGNIYVGASPWQMLGNLAQQYSGQLNLEDADKKEMAYALRQKQQDMEDLQAGMQLYQGTPGRPAVPEAYKMPENQFAPRDDEGNLMPGTSYTPAIAAVEAQAPNPQAAMARLLGSTGPKASAMGGELMKQMFKEPNWKETSINVDGKVVKGLYDANKGDVLGTFRPFNTSVDIPLANAEYSGVLRGGMSSSGTTPNQNVAPVNYSSITSDPRLQKTIAFENPTAENITSKLGGTAHGPFQINQGTFNLVTSKVPELKGITFEQFKQSVPLQEKVASKLHDFNDQTLSSNGVPLNDVTRQAMWFSGNPAFAKAVENPQLQNQPVVNFLSPEQVQANKIRPDYTINQFRNDVLSKTSQVGQQKTQETSKYELPVPTNFQSRKEQDEWLADSRKPLTGETKAKADGGVDTLRALDKYQTLINDYSRSQTFTPDTRAMLSQAHSELMLKLKDANKLGVLNKGDLPLLEKLIVNPNNLSSLLLSKDILEKQIVNQKQTIRDVVKDSYLNSGKQIPEPIKQQLIALDQSLEAAKATKPSKTSTTTGGSWGQATVVTK